MKKWLAAAMSLILTFLTAFPVSGTDISQVGAVTSLAPGFQGREFDLSRSYQYAYRWAAQLHASQPDGGHFTWGDSTGQLLHAWEEKQMIQIFIGGNSSCRDSQGRGWAALVCANPYNCNTVILRDGAAAWYLDNRALSGPPRTNQYWRMEKGTPVLYQQFANGYLRMENGEIGSAVFYSRNDGGNYESPPIPPTPYGSIDEISEDGCTWENPVFMTGLADRYDINQDGYVNISDVMELCKCLARRAARMPFTFEELTRMDVNRDYMIGISDVMELCKALARMV